MNLAALLENNGKTGEAEKLLQQAMDKHSAEALPFFTAGLFFIRQQALSRALPLLDKAVQLAPDNPRYSYAYAAALYKNGQTAHAVNMLEKNMHLYPDNIDNLEALVFYYRELGNTARAGFYSERLNKVINKEQQQE